MANYACTSICVSSILENNKIVFVSVPDSFTDLLQQKLIEKYDSLDDYARTIGMERHAFRWAFKKRNGHQLIRIIRICKDIGISKEELYRSIISYYSYGSHNKPIRIQDFIEINALFVEGYGLYVAEGDTGYSGTKKARKLRLTNSEPTAINFFAHWLDAFFPDINYYVMAMLPEKQRYYDNMNELRIGEKRLKISKGKYNKKIKYRICMDNAIVVDLILDTREQIRAAVLKDEELAAAYVRGIMAGEGTVYNNRSKYVRLEMKTADEINFVRKLLDILGITCTHHKRTTREGMESLYIGGKENIKKYYELVGFGCETKRQEKLKKLVEAGIQEISLNPDTVIKTTLKIAEKEKELGIK